MGVSVPTAWGRDLVSYLLVFRPFCKKRRQQCFLFLFVLKEETELGMPTRDLCIQKEVAGHASQPHTGMQVLACWIPSRGPSLVSKAQGTQINECYLQESQEGVSVNWHWSDLPGSCSRWLVQWEIELWSSKSQPCGQTTEFSCAETLILDAEFWFWSSLLLLYEK